MGAVLFVRGVRRSEEFAVTLAIMSQYPLTPADLNTHKLIFYVLAGVLLILSILALAGGILVLAGGYWEGIIYTVVAAAEVVACILGIYGVMKGVRVWVFYFMIFAGVLSVLQIISVVFAFIVLAWGSAAIGCVWLVFILFTLYYAYVLWKDRL